MTVSDDDLRMWEAQAQYGTINVAWVIRLVRAVRSALREKELAWEEERRRLADLAQRAHDEVGRLKDMGDEVRGLTRERDELNDMLADSRKRHQQVLEELHELKKQVLGHTYGDALALRVKNVEAELEHVKALHIAAVNKCGKLELENGKLRRLRSAVDALRYAVRELDEKKD